MLSKLFLSGACYWYLNWTVGEPLPEKAVAVGVEVYQVNQTAILDYTYVARGPAIDSEEIFMIHQQKAYVSSIHREVNATHDTFVYEKYLTHPPDTEAPILACDTRQVSDVAVFRTDGFFQDVKTGKGRLRHFRRSCRRL